MFLSRVARQHDVERGQKRHEKRDAFGAAQFAKLLEQGQGEEERVARASVGGKGGARVIDGKLKNKRRSFQAALPEIELLVSLGTGEEFALPDGEIAILEREIGQG